MSQASRDIRTFARARLREGLVALAGEEGTLRLEGRDVPAREVLAALDRAAARGKATDEAKAAYHRAVAAEKEAEAALAPLEKAVHALVRATATEEQLAACGLRRRKARRALTADERSAATEKLRATREANGTRGARQRRLADARSAIEAAYAERPFVGGIAGATPDVASGGHHARAAAGDGLIRGPT